MAQEFESQFKPIVSGSDYLSGSEFGQVAGALLARRDKQDKKQAKRALLASAVLEGLGALQRNQKQSVIDAINETNEKYSDIFEENKEYYNDESIAEQRKLYQLYKNEKTRDTALLTQAIRTFNQDSDIMATYGPNAFTTVSQMKKTPEGNQTLADEIDLLKDQAKNYFESITDEAITLPTFTKYNAKAKNAYLAAIAEVKNDPTKKGLVRAAWLKVFGRDKEGNPRFGLVQQDKLKRARETAESIAGIATDIDKQRVENINKEAEIKTDKKNNSIFYKHLKLVILELYYCWHESKNQMLAVSMSKRGYLSRSRYNPNKISSYIIKVVHFLKKEEYIKTYKV